MLIAYQVILHQEDSQGNCTLMFILLAALQTDLVQEIVVSVAFYYCEGIRVHTVCYSCVLSSNAVSFD